VLAPVATVVVPVVVVAARVQVRADRAERPSRFELESAGLGLRFFLWIFSFGFFLGFFVCRSAGLTGSVRRLRLF
jgi:hypothetical protein